MRQRFTLGQRQFQLDVVSREPLRVKITEEENEREWVLDGDLKSGAGRIFLEGRYRPYFVSRAGGAVWVSLDGRTLVFEQSKTRASAEQVHGGFMAPMPGKVTRVAVEEGETVAAGQVLVVMEAMKMEHRIEAPGDGRVTRLHCREGEMVEGGANLLEFEPA